MNDRFFELLEKVPTWVLGLIDAGLFISAVVIFIRIVGGE